MTDFDATNDLATHSLELVHRELHETLDSARHEIEEYVDGQASQEALARAAQYLHLASGALRIVEIHGAALLADEMEQTCLFLIESESTEAADKGVQALTRSMVQLPAYLDRLLSGGRDVALVLLPLLNDLRAVRGRPLMSEGTLLLLKTGPLERMSKVDGAGRPMAVDDVFASVARKQRPAFQTALLGWIRGEQVEHNLDELILVSSTLEHSATEKYVQQFWGVLCAVFVALRAGGLDASVALKRLIGQADRQLKRLADAGESDLVEAPPEDLLNNLLYYVARASCDDERVVAVRSDFGLDELVPGDAQLERARESLAGPSVRLMRTVAVAIKQDLGAVKDSLDIFVRTGMQDFRQLLPQLEMLAKIGDTLGVLGLEKAQTTIESQVRELNEIADAGQSIDEQVLEAVAAVILKVEDELDQELIRAVLPGNGEAGAPSEAEVQYSQVTQAVMNECIANMARVKDAVAKFVEEPSDTRPLEQVAPQLRGIAAGLLMLNKAAAVRLIERVGAVIADGLVTGDTASSPEHVERLADAIVSLEYYMETVSAGRKDPWYMLDNAARCLDLLERRRPVAATETHEEAARHRRPAGIDEAEGIQPSAKTPEAIEPEAAEERLEVLSVLGEEAGRADPELLEIFIEEAKSELEKINVNLRAWLSDTQKTDALVATRRSFHTLKGSGRTVGASAIGEFAWSVENLMNRLINQTLRLSAPITAFIADAVKALAELIDQLELGIAPKVDVDQLCARANALAAGEAPSAQVPAGEAPAGAEAAVSAAQIDPVLAEIFVKEIRGHLATLREYLDKARQSMSAPVVGEALYRAGHTLLGSANMANYEPCIAVAGPLSEYLRRCYDNKRPVGGSAVSVLSEAADAIEAIADALLAHEVVMPEAELVDQLESLADSAVPTPAESSLDVEAGAVEEAGDAPEQVSDAALAEAVSFDPEIAAIFADEAAEILDQTELSVQELRSSTDPAVAVGELQRLLHTLKGGARMAGIVEMGNLSHALETLLSSLASGRIPMHKGAVDLVQRTLDELQLMRDSVEAGRVIRDSSQLQVDLQQAAVAAPAEAPVPEPEAREASEAEPVDLSREDILEQTINRPLDFDFTREEPSDAEQVGIATTIMPGLEVKQFGSGGGDGEIELTGTVEFSDEEMARLQQLAFEQTLVRTAETPLGRPAAEAPAPETPDAERVRGDVEQAAPPAPAEPSPEPSQAAPERPREEPAELPAARQAAAEDLPAAAESSPAEAVPLETPAAEEEAWVAESAPAEERVPVAPAAGQPAAPLAAAGLGEAPVVAKAAPSEATRPAERVDTARVDADLLNALLNSSGEISIFQARLNQQLHSIDFHLSELGQTVTRLREQLRKLEAETEAEILHRHQEDAAENRDFDPLELDRYSTIQQLSRALAETANDVASINDLLQGLTAEADTLLTQQGRVTAEIQGGLMQTRMVPFQRHVARFARVVRQAAVDSGKVAEFHVDGASSELDREVLDAMLPAFEHLLRNSVVHGIEPAEERNRRGKPSAGQIHLRLRREGSEVSIEISDDGAGLNLDAIRRTAIEQGLLSEDQEITQRQAAELILQPGFSTARELTQAAGRGVGMDIVDNELKKLGGSMHIDTSQGRGTKFVIRLPYTLAITHALIVNVGDETFALPLTTVEGITRVRREHLLDLLTQDDPRLDYGELSYRLQHLGTLVGGAPSALPEDESAVALVLIRSGENSTALLTDNLEGSREVVVKGLGPHIASIAGVTGATILGDGRVIMILDAGTLIRRQPRRQGAPAPSVVAPEKRALTALVVDDSITMRRVTERLLERRGIRVVTARDGLDAVTVLQETDPDIVLLDIEMPRMDGYQFAAHVRNDEKFRDLPIIMITSRSGQKHRAKAIELGVNEYLSKPYQENQLIAAIEEQLGIEL